MTYIFINIAWKKTKTKTHRQHKKWKNTLNNKNGTSGESGLRIGSRWATNDSHYQTKSVKLPKWWFLPNFLLSGTHVTCKHGHSQQPKSHLRAKGHSDRFPWSLSTIWISSWRGGVSQCIWLTGLLQDMPTLILIVQPLQLLSTGFNS